MGRGCQGTEQWSGAWARKTSSPGVRVEASREYLLGTPRSLCDWNSEMVSWIMGMKSEWRG